jgi:hypothetical protein
MTIGDHAGSLSPPNRPSLKIHKANVAGERHFGLSEIDQSGISHEVPSRFFRGMAATVKHKRPNQKNNIAISDGYREGAAINLAAFTSASGWLPGCGSRRLQSE